MQVEVRGQLAGVDAFCCVGTTMLAQVIRLGDKCPYAESFYWLCFATQESRLVSTEWVFKHFSIFLMSPGLYISISQKFPWLVQCLICTSNTCIFAISPKGLLISPYYHKSEVRIIIFRKIKSHVYLFITSLKYSFTMRETAFSING